MTETRATAAASTTTIPHPNRWKALSILALAQFLIILDTSIIGVALPTIQQHFSITQAELQWIFNAYVISFGTMLLIGGRLSDIFGQKRIFVIGFIVLTVSSILAGIAFSNDMLIASRAMQGLGAALIAPSALSIVMSLFASNKSEMNKAMGIWGAAAPAGGTAGVFLGGIITAWLDWPWVFLINVPIGIAVLALTPKLLPRAIKRKGSVDFLGAVYITSALVLLVYAIVTANDVGWMSMQTIFLMASVSVMVGAFLAIQRRKKEPLIPLNIFRTRNLLASNIVMALLGAAWIPMWFFLNLYIQQILGYGSMESGLALLPMTVMIMVLMISYTPRLVNRFGLKKNMIAGMALLAVAMVLFSVTPSAASSDISNSTIDNENLIYMIYVLPASLVAALGMSLAYIPVLTAAVSNVSKEESGLGSGLVNTSYQIGSALGLAIMVAISSGHTETLQNLGIEQIAALNRGFHLAFIGATVVSIIAAVLIIVSIKKIQQPEKLSSTKH